MSALPDRSYSDDAPGGERPWTNIAAAAGFRSKDALLVALFEQLSERLAEVLRPSRPDLSDERRRTAVHAAIGVINSVGHRRQLDLPRAELEEMLVSMPSWRCSPAAPE